MLCQSPYREGFDDVRCIRHQSKCAERLNNEKTDMSNACVIVRAVEKHKVTTFATSSESVLQPSLKLPTPVIESCPSGFYLKVTEVAKHALLVEEKKNFTEKFLQHIRQYGFFKRRDFPRLGRIYRDDLLQSD